LPEVAILGAGMSGMAAARSLRDLNYTIYEAGDHAGGHAASFFIDKGFLFDEGPHVSFTSDDRIKRFLARSVNDRFSEFPTHVTNYFEGTTLKHPVQCNLHGLSPEVIARCITDFVRAQYEDKRPIENYKDWCYRGLGESISEIFSRRYTRKYWNLELEQLTADWVSDRVYAPKLEEVLQGALTKQTSEHYYLSNFRYPLKNGFGGYSALLEHDSRIEFGMCATEIDIDNKKIIFANGRSESYDHLISSAPLPELVSMCRDSPAAVREAAKQLACTSHFILSIGINRPHVSDACWTYYYDEDIPFSRASFPSKFSANNAPPDCSSIQVEVVHSRYRSIPSNDVLVENCMDSLIKVGLLHSREEIVALDARDIRYANVLFDFNRAKNLATVRDYMSRKGVKCCGRFGEWAYLWSDQAMLSGERAANEVRALLSMDGLEFDK